MSDLLGEDPAAEFLAQEGEQLRDLGIEEDQFNMAASDPFAAPAEPAAEPIDATPAADVNFIDEFEGGEFGGDVSEPQEPMVNGYQDLGGMSDAAPVMQQPVHAILPPEEPESLTNWRQEKATALQQQVRQTFIVCTLLGFSVFFLSVRVICFNTFFPFLLISI